MTKLFAITTSLLMLLQGLNIHVNDLLELDYLMEHYEFHAEAYGDNFIVFLSKHYGELQAEHSEKHQEEQKQQGNQELPFQHHAQSHPLVVIVPDLLIDSAIRTEITNRQKANFFYCALYDSRYGDGPFQPPKQA